MRFCAACGFDEAFTAEGICTFFEHYLRQGGANTSLPGYMSAWREFADSEGIPFPSCKSRAGGEIAKFLRGCQVRHPHTVTRSVPLTLSLLSGVAAHLGVRSLSDIQRRGSASRETLSFLARLLISHQACLRPMEHSACIVLRDITLGVGYASIRIGVVPSARKIKRRPPRVCVLPYGYGRFAHLAAGSVLRVLVARVHSHSTPSTPLFCRYSFGVPSRQHQPWHPAGDLSRLRAIISIALPSIDVSLIDGRSLRSGGATDWFAAGASASWVMAQGGWTSDAVLIYDRPSEALRGSILERGFLRTGLQFSHAGRSLLPSKRPARSRSRQPSRRRGSASSRARLSVHSASQPSRILARLSPGGRKSRI